MSSRRLALGAVLIAFAVVALARLNPFCLFEPDEPDYLFSARSLARLEGVREIDHPARPLHVFRPPGLPLMLAPLALVRPYDVEAAKVVVLLAAVAALWLLYRYARLIGSESLDAAVAVVLVAASPYTLLHATEVVTELPFLAAALGALWIVGTRLDRPSKAAFWSAAALLAGASLVRTVGLALIVALAVWAFGARRRVWVLASAVAAAPTLVWMWRCSRTGAPTYLGAVADAVQRLGFGGYLSAALRQAGWYLERMPGLILPGFSDGRPVYERVLLDTAPGIGLPAAVTLALAACVVAAALAGMWQGRRRGGSLAGIFVVAYVAMLAVYPPKHERLAWPLVPLLWVWAAAGAREAALRWSRRGPAVARVAAMTIAAAAVVVVAVESAGSFAMVRANRLYHGEGAQFYTNRMPPMYYADWQAAGKAVASRSSAHERVLTRHSDVGFTSRRFQDSVRFEEVAPRQWRGAIASLPARYLVLSEVRCGEGIRWQMFDADPVYRYVVRHAERGAVVLEITPNRDGMVSLESPLLSREIAACRDAVERLPGRDDLRRRLADLLGEAGRPTEGLAVLQPLTAENRARAEAWLTRSDLLLDLDRLDDAAAALERATSAPGAEWLENTLARGRRVLQEKRAQPAMAPAERARRLVTEGLDRLEVLDARAAVERIARAEQLAPADPEILAAHATVARRTGRRPESRALFAHLAQAGDPAATTMLAELDRESALETGAFESDAVAWLRVAHFQAGDGTPGRALSTLERAADRFPQDRAVRKTLADLYLFFGDVERAEPLLRALATEDRQDAAAARSLARCDELLRPADY